MLSIVLDENQYFLMGIQAIFGENKIFFKTLYVQFLGANGAE